MLQWEAGETISKENVCNCFNDKSLFPWITIRTSTSTSTKKQAKKIQLFYTRLQIQPVSYRSLHSTNKQLHDKSQSPPLYTFLSWPRSDTAAAVRRPTKTVPMRVSFGHYHLCSLKIFCSEYEHIEAKKNSARCLFSEFQWVVKGSRSLQTEEFNLWIFASRKDCGTCLGCY